MLNFIIFQLLVRTVTTVLEEATDCIVWFTRSYIIQYVALILLIDGDQGKSLFKPLETANKLKYIYSAPTAQ
jgi:hypothetical protein